MSETPIDHLSFEEAMNELDTVVRRLESGNIKLDEAVSTYERGMALQKHCAQKLKTAKAKIDLLITDQKTIIGVKDLNDTETA